MVNEGFRKYKMLTKVDASINLLNILLIDPMHFAFPLYGVTRIDPWLNLVMQQSITLVSIAAMALQY